MGLHEIIHANNGLKKLLAEEVLLKSSQLWTRTTVCSHRVIQTKVFGRQRLLCRPFILTYSGTVIALQMITSCLSVWWHRLLSKGVDVINSFTLSVRPAESTAVTFTSAQLSSVIASLRQNFIRSLVIEVLSCSRYHLNSVGISLADLFQSDPVQTHAVRRTSRYLQLSFSFKPWWGNPHKSCIECLDCHLNNTFVPVLCRALMYLMFCGRPGPCLFNLCKWLI